MANLFMPAIKTDIEAQVQVRSWVAALRGGDYTQGIGALRRRGNFCCLGVACDVSGMGAWDDERFILADNSAEGEALLPTSVKEHFHLRSSAGDYGSTCLSSRNDNGSSFTEIADIIEHELELAVA